MAEIKRLIDTVETATRFSEVDSMGVVWHGNYVKYLEDGRESFGRKFGLGYFDVYANELMTPIVNLNIDYKRMTRYGDSVIIETKYIPTQAAKIIFEYKITNAKTNQVVLTAESTQVFIDKEGELQLTNPDFYSEWQKKWGQIEE